ncbi:MAG: hypothetical protein AAGI52_06565 [Bacteroidota bacterium]
MTPHERNSGNQAEARWALLSALYEARHGFLSEGVMAKECAEEGVKLTRQGLHRVAQYLAGRGLAEIDEQEGSGAWRVRITPEGVDLVEHVGDCPDGIARPETGASVRQRQLREARWRVLQTLSIGMPYATSERIILKAINDIDLELSEQQLRQELSYLARTGLSVIDDEQSIWKAHLTPDGVDVVEYVRDAPPGVERPEKYW